jgi:hypothetical protein
VTTPVQPDALSGLRGYHLPEPVSWWPPAPGWWLLALLALLTALALLAVAWRRYRHRAALRAALAELDSLGRDHGDADPAALARQLSRLLRRFALTRYPRHEVAGLSGDDWLRFLDAHGGGKAFTEGAGRLLKEAPYRPAGDSSAFRELAALARSWVLHNAAART